MRPVARLYPAALLAVFVLWLITSTTIALADSCSDENNIVTNDGQCWRSLRPLEKMAIVQGIWVGQKVRANTLEMAGDSGSIWFGMDWASVPEHTSIGDIVDYFDRLYETPANRKIEWHNAYLLAALMVRDDDENDRISLLTFLRSNEELPTYGTLAGVKAPNVLEIRAGAKTFSIRLTATVVPESIAKKTTAFLMGLKLGAYGGNCEKVEPTPVTLYYGAELFDNEGQFDR